MQPDTQADQLTKTQQNIEAYLSSHDVKYIADNAVFIHMGTGNEYHGKEAIAVMLNHMYHVAFNATANFTNKIITEHKAMAEGLIIGTHIGEFDGILPTQKQISVPVCVSYDIEDGLIIAARVYMMRDMLINQLQNHDQVL